MEGGDNSSEAEKAADIDEDSIDKQKPEVTSKMKENLFHEKLLRRKHRCIESHWDMSDDTNSDLENKENVTNNQNIWSVNQNLLLNRYSSKCRDEANLCQNNKTEDEKVKFSRGYGADMSVALQSSVENLMKYAEILYKCKLCTTLPSILTSKDTFLSHVSDQHLGNSEMCKECSICKLKFGTEEDLRAHQSAEHLRESVSHDSKSSGSGVECEKNDKLTSEKHKSFNSDFSEKVCSDQDDRDELLNSEQCRHDNKPQEHPKLVITHGEMRNTPTVSVCENITKLQKLTDQILASNKKEIEGTRKSNSPVPPFSLMTPNYTVEFGKYTKLVREGGNIVYFCQLCNWKTQVKLQFQGHCTNSSHINKVKAAGQNDNEAHSSTGGGKCSEHKGQITPDSRHGDKEYKEPVGWTPRGHMSFLTETSGFYIGHSQKQEDMKDLRNIKNVKCSPQNPEGGQTPGETEKDQENSPDKLSNSEKIETKLNKRKRSAPVVLRNQSGCEDGWGSDELDNDSVEIKSPSSPLTLSLQNSGGKKRLLENVKETSDRISVDKGGSNNSPPMSPQTTPTCGGDNVGGELREITPLRMEGKHIDKEHTTSRVLKEEDLERTTAMIKQYFEDQLGFRGLDQPLKTSSDPHEWPIPGKTFLRNGNHGHSIATPQPSYSTRERVYLYSCSLCDFGCHDIQDYRLHFENEHSQNHDVDPYESVSDGRGESWKMWKIKELLPDLICVYPRGNVSRDLLLQKISVILNIPEVVQWGPACNKAVREQFPHSLAQRKGKYKKTFFFGVTLLEQLQEQDDVSEGEGVQYQPLRDMSQDMEKILGHLHSLVHWTGNMESGISRDEILELLKGRIEEPDVQHWGVQCNRAIRVLFPNVEMKRKGKYKTVFFGVDFRHDIHKQTFIPNKRGRPRKSPYLHGRDPDEMLQRRLNWLDTMRTSGQMDDHNFLDISNHGESRSDRSLSTTRGWGPGSLFNMVQTYNSRDNSESPVMFMYDADNPSIKMQYLEEEDSELSPPDFRSSEYLHRKSELFNNDRLHKQNSSNSDKFTVQSLNLSFQDNTLAKERFRHGDPNSGSSPKPDLHFCEKSNFGDSTSPSTSDYSRSKLFNVHNLCQSSVKEKEFKPLSYPIMPLPPMYRSCYGDEMKERSPYKFRPWSQSVVSGTSVNDDDEYVDDDEGNKSKVDEDESGDGDDEGSNDAVTSQGTKLQKTRWRTSTDSKGHRQNQDMRAGHSKYKSGNIESENSSDSDGTQDGRGNINSTNVYQKREHKQDLHSGSKRQNNVDCDEKNNVQNSDNCVKSDTADNANEANAHVIEPVIGNIPSKQGFSLYQKCSIVSEHDDHKSFNHSCSQIVESNEPMLIVEEQSRTSPKT